jgi:uncharacterized protein (TIGR02147 family)
METTVAQILLKEIKDRKKSNPNYSIRAFARDLQLSAGFLSDVLKEKRTLSSDRAAEIGKKLKYNKIELSHFVNISRYSNAKNSSHKKLIQDHLKSSKKMMISVRKMKADQFAVIADWYHFAILELVEIEGFESSPDWIAKRLKISVSEVEMALDRLAKLKMISINDKGFIRKLENNEVMSFPSAAIRKFHTQQLNKAKEALERLQYESRIMQGITMAVDPKKIPQAQELITEFRNKMYQLFENGDKKNVYHLAIQLFPLDI